MKTKITRSKKWPCITLKPLFDFLCMIHPEGINLDVVADELGTTSKNLSHMFLMDNMYLSKAESIVMAYGYKVILKYTYDYTFPDGCVNRYDYPYAGNLYGIVDYCNNTNRTINYVACCSKCKRDTIASALSRGDISLTILNQIAFSIGVKIEWEFIKQ